MRSDQALQKFLALLKPNSQVLDIGSGDGDHAKVMRESGHSVTTLDPHHPADIQNHYLANRFDHKFDAIWCSHVLEHQTNPGVFLQSIFGDLKDAGVLGLTVPPPVDKLAGGHVVQFSPSMLIYQLILAGFDCRHASVGVYGHNISVVMCKKRVDRRVFNSLVHDNGDIETLAEFFPWTVRQGIRGSETGEVNWT